MADKGKILVNVYKGKSYVPLKDINVILNPSENKNDVISLKTNVIGQTEVVDVGAPPIELSQKPEYTERPYSLWDITVRGEGFKEVVIKNAQVLPDVTAVQDINLMETGNMRETEVKEEIIDVQPNRLYGKFPPKIPEAPEKTLPKSPGGGFVVLDQVSVPEYVIVHAGTPTNTGAPNYTVPFKDYIKNVASSEIYATWPESTIRANIYCILSFTLNRVFTEWYEGKGYRFTITNSTAFDHAFSYGRNIFDNISRIVDEIFTSYIKRRGAKQPLLTQYCDGERVKCPGWLTQWGSKYLGDQGKTPYEILTHFYGSDIDLEKAPKVSGIPKSYPGYTLEIGSNGEPVRNIQTYLNRISQNYPLIPKVAVDGVYGPTTAESVKVFQQIFNLPQTGKVDYATWYQISNIYVGVSKIAELRGSIGLNDNELENVSRELGIFVPPTFITGRGLDMPTIDFPIE
ncbi:peptidoglycan-binding protein [Clostridium ihumii]|uniref:peptidoglycan-binding domain-containing protein n=1 Tax=Clostridium ihumii TaxID=1470356 RepID=UPI003D34978D